MADPDGALGPCSPMSLASCNTAGTMCSSLDNVAQQVPPGLCGDRPWELPHCLWEWGSSTRGTGLALQGYAAWQCALRLESSRRKKVHYRPTPEWQSSERVTGKLSWCDSPPNSGPVFLTDTKFTCYPSWALAYRYCVSGRLRLGGHHFWCGSSHHCVSTQMLPACRLDSEERGWFLCALLAQFSNSPSLCKDKSYK